MKSSISKLVHKTFLNTKVGDLLGFLTFSGEGGMFLVKERKSARGIGGTITLTLEKETSQDESATISYLDLRKDGPYIALMGRFRVRKPRSASKSATPATHLEPAVEALEDGTDEDLGKQDQLFQTS